MLYTPFDSVIRELKIRLEYGDCNFKLFLTSVGYCMSYFVPYSEKPVILFNAA